ncbi:hypothetical protein BCR37DRAFT_392551 [Protomyces lactucae-debilis]|uniref:Uncharacterized protein n=1 Tax=Protomyces lactucae-debilis TaxID=2754530 RepID=A0A1Y2FGY0_PROLT|nr:uncharacterized protein BCR37DRAFT_392551 [Protomyces lactucae-debilis]ORY83208.1 hypothetical protein BCR37DRAFT_392551 [Protomyces lactucae-debilis]
MDEHAYRLLEEQLAELLACSYTPSLASLAGALEKTALADIEIWAKYHPEAHDALAELLIGSFSCDTHALFVVEQFSRQKDLRDAMLTCHPALFENLLRQALVNQKSFEKYTAVLCAFLECKLPEGCLPPVQLPLFMGMLNEAVTNIDETRYLVYMEGVLLNNADVCFSTLSATQQYAWQATLAGFLSNPSNELVILALSCLASLANMMSSAQAGKNGSSASTLFQGDKGLKVARLVVGSVSAALSTTGEGFQRRHVEYATNAMHALSRQVLDEWLAKKEGQSLCRKLNEKLDLLLDEEIVEVAAAFLSAMKGVQQIQGIHEIAARLCERAMDHLEAKNASLPLAKAFASLSSLLPATSSASDRALSFLLNKQKDESKSVAECNRWLLKGLSNTKISATQLIKHSSSLTAWAALPKGAGPLLAHDRDVCKLLISSALAEASHLHLLPVLDKLTDMLIPTLDQFKVCRQSSRPIALQQQPNTPASGQSSKDWRAKLLVDLQAEAAHQHDILVARVDLVCRDLEIRAETTELPMRTLKDALNAANEEASMLKSQLQEVQTEMRQRERDTADEQGRVNEIMDSMRRELAQRDERLRQCEHNERQNHDKLQESKKYASDLVSRHEQECQDLKKRLTMALESANAHNIESGRVNERLMMEAREYNAAMAKLKTLSSAREGQVAELQLALQAKDEALKSKDSAMRTMEVDALEMKRELTASLQALTSEHETARKQLVNEINAMTLQKQQDAVQLQTTTHGLGQVQTNMEKLQESLLHMTRERDLLLQQVETIKMSADEKLELLAEQHAMAQQTLQDDLKANKSRYEYALETGERERQRLRSALTSLRAKYEARLAEFQEAQELSRRLMAVMGGNSGGLSNNKTPMGKAAVSDADMTPLRATPWLGHQPVKQRERQRDLPAQASPQRHTKGSRQQGGHEQLGRSVRAPASRSATTLAHPLNTSAIHVKRKEASPAQDQASKRRESIGIFHDPVAAVPSTMEQFLQDADIDLEDYDATRDITVCVQRDLDKENQGVGKSGKKPLRRDDSSILEELSGLGI